ncbi:hypothetical protein EG329_011212 [Mollisiaceae sp. DMI_Dod_QoI]|nr:hypothetical protein EG329_011212 [Helotiales sp. DMI_Dod_QoI]
MQELITKVTSYVEKYMSNYDGSHDFDHIKRVVGLAHHIHSQMTTSPPKSNIPSPPLDLDVITLAALLHDIGDRKYIEEGQDEKTMVRELLLGLGASPELAARVQTICLGVSYSSEIKDFDHVVGLIARHPELAVVQDADRIDAIGAVGIGRVHTYGGAKTQRGMEQSMEVFDYKLFKLEGLMKTVPGKQLAKERTERLRTFYQWWREEKEFGELGASVLGHEDREKKEC